MLTRITLDNLLNGVSRQPDNIRLASQAEEQVNAVSDIVKGLRKRPGLDHIAGLSGINAGAAFHIVDRDPSRRFLISCASGQIKAWNLNTGAPATITYEANQNYLVTALTAKESFRFLTVADYTFVVNSTVNTAMTADVTSRGTYKALLFFRNIKAGQWYTVYFSGQAVARMNTNEYGQLEAFQAGVVQQLKAYLPEGATWAVTSMPGGVVGVERRDNLDFRATIDTPESEATIIKDRIQSFDQLPASGYDGMKVQIYGGEGSKLDNWWVKFVPDPVVGATNPSNRRGVWEECQGHGLQTVINKATMPHVLVIDSNGTSLTWKQVDWGQRLVGDNDTAPLPTFIGKPIEDIFFYRNRLGFLSDESVCMSESGEFFNFFPTTVTDLLDSDPIDVGTSHTKVALLKKAVPMNERLLVTANNVQFFDNLSTEGLLTPKTVGFKVRSEYLNSITHSNIEVAKTTALFPQKIGNWSRIWEYIPENNTVPGAQLALDVTEHVPDFLGGNVTDAVYHQSTDSMYFLTDAYPNRIYVYRWLIQDNKRVQASWSYWEFEDGRSGIVDIFAVDQYLYVVSRHDSTTDYRLGRVNLECESCFTSPTASFHVHLDNKMQLTGVYDSVNKWTTWTLPAAWPTNTAFKVLRGMSFATQKGIEVKNVTRPTTTTVRAPGNLSEAACFLGTPYTMTYKFSKFYMRDEGGQAIEDGRTACKSITMQLKDTGYLKAHVSREGQTDRTYETGPEIGNTLSGVTLMSAPFRVPLYTSNKNLVFKVTSDSPYPAYITKAFVVIDYNNNDRSS